MEKEGLLINDIGNSERADGGDLKALFWDDWQVKCTCVGDIEMLSLYVRSGDNVYVLIRRVGPWLSRIGMRAGQLRWLP